MEIFLKKIKRLALRMVKHIRKHTSHLTKHVHKHKQRYSLGTFGTFAIINMVVVAVGLIGSLSTIQDHASASNSGSSTIFEDNFDDGDYNGWTLGYQGGSVIDGKLVMNAGWGDTYRADYPLTQHFIMETSLSDAPGNNVWETANIAIYNPSYTQKAGIHSVRTIYLRYQDGDGSLSIGATYWDGNTENYPTLTSINAGAGLDTRTLKFEVDGNTYKGYVNGTLYIEYEDAFEYRSLMAQQYPALRADNVGATFDDFRLELFENGDEEEVSYPENLYVVGDHQGWDPETAPMLHGDGNGNYEGFLTLNQAFKLISAREWGTGVNYGGSLGALVDGGEATLTVVTPGYYYINVDLTTLTASTTLITSVGLIGSFSSWTYDEEMIYNSGNNVWTLNDFAMSTGEEFKVRFNGNWGLGLGNDINNLSREGGGNLVMAEAGIYNFTLSIETKPYQLSYEIAGHQSAFSCALVTDIPESECETLVTFYTNNNGGARWNHENWLTTTTAGNRNGVTVSDGHVIGLSLGWMDLSGPIDFSGLPELTTILFNNDSISSITLDGLTKLTYLNLYGNQLTSVDLSDSTSLTYLDIGENKLTSIDLSGLSQLTNLYLNNNLLTTLPESTTNLTNLDIVDLHGNGWNISSMSNNLISFLNDKVGNELRQVKSNPFYPRQLYVPGDHNRDITTAPILHGDGSGHYEGFIMLESVFKFCGKPERSLNRGGSLSALEENAESNISIGKAGYYYITVDLTNLTATTTLITSVGLVGEFNGRGTSPDLKMQYNAIDDVREATGVELAAGSGFKVRFNNDRGLNLGGNMSGMTRGEPDNLVIPEAGTYNITLSIGTTPYQLSYGNALADADIDGIADGDDNCPSVANPNQANTNVGSTLFVDNFNDGNRNGWKSWNGWRIINERLVSPAGWSTIYRPDYPLPQKFSIEALASDIVGRKARNDAGVTIYNPSFPSRQNWIPGVPAVEQIMLRYSDVDGNLNISVSYWDGTRMSWPTIASENIETSHEPRTLKLEVDGNHYKGYVDGELSIEVEDSFGYRDLMIEEYPALYTDNTISTFDDFRLVLFENNIGDACDCMDDVCTEGNDIYGNPICTNGDPVCYNSDVAGELNSHNIITTYGCKLDAIECDLSNQNISSIAPNTFINHTNLESLYLNDNNISSIETTDFAGLNNLINLYLNNNKISSIENGDFEGRMSTTQNFVYSHISMAGGFNDWGDTELTPVSGTNNRWETTITLPETTLKFKANHGRSTSRGSQAFPSGYGIHNLYGGADIPVPAGTYYIIFNTTNGYYNFSTDPIDTPADDDTFVGLPNLRVLDLSNNLLPSIEKDDFKGLYNLDELNLSGNQIKNIDENDLSEAVYLKVLNLSDNGITDIDDINFEGFSGLSALFLGGNEITFIGENAFLGLDNLRALGLQYNQISSLNPGDFNGLPVLGDLYLNNNQISSIGVNDFDGIMNEGRYSMGIVGDSTPSGSRGVSVDMHRVSGRINKWSVVTSLTTGGVGFKFRANRNRNDNRGGYDSPTGTAVKNGKNLLVSTPGEYLITLDLSTMTYSYELIDTDDTSKDIKEFVIDGVAGVITDTNITLNVPTGTDITNLTPSISHTATASISPGLGKPQDFTHPVTYTLIAGDDTTKTYTVTVDIDHEEFPDVPKLTELDLSNNKISRLDNSVFGLSAILNLGGNQVISIENRNLNGYINLLGLTLAPSCNTDGLKEISYTNGPTNTDSNNCVIVPDNSTTHFIDELGNKGYEKDAGYYKGDTAISFNEPDAVSKILAPIVMQSTDLNGYDGVYYNSPTEVQYESGTTITTYSGEEFTGVLHGPVVFATGSTPGVTDVISLMRFGELTQEIDFSQPVIIRLPAPGKVSGDMVNIYRSEAEDVFVGTNPERVSEGTGTVILIEGIPYVEFTVTQASRYVISDLDEKDIGDEDVVPTPLITPGLGGGNKLVKDICPIRDCSDHGYYDKLCGKCSLIEKIIDASPIHFSADEEVGDTTDSPFSIELNNAYLWAYTHDITTMPTIQSANIEGTLTRKDMAKMISNFAINVLGKNLSTGATCEFSDITTLSKETQYYAMAACRLGLMGYESDGVTLKTSFNPDQEVNRGQSATILSRLLRGTKNDGGVVYYENHLKALKEEGIMTKIENPAMKEMRGRVMLMLQRTSEKK